MIEIAFSESARGSLKIAQHYGKGKYNGGAVGVILSGSFTQAEIEAARRRAEEQEKRRWEEAVPLDGNPGDVYGFDLALSVGDISGDCLGIERQRALEAMCSVWNMPDISVFISEKIERAKADLETVLVRNGAGEPVRIWYSHNPDELCGLHWLMAAMCPLKGKGDIYAVELPPWIQWDDDTVVRYNGWNDVSPGEFGRFVTAQKRLSDVFVKACAGEWRQMQTENMPLRAVLNGRMTGVPENFYDSFIRREIGRQDGIFHEARLIGDIIGKYQLGIGDGWISRRIDAMIRNSELSIVEEAPEGGPVYRKKLKKVSG